MSNSPDKDCKAQIAAIAKAMRAPSLADYEDAVKPGEPFAQNFLAVLRKALDERTARSLAKRIGLANLTPSKNFDTFDRSPETLPNVDPDDLGRVLDCSFMEDKADVILIGPAGRGKTHLAMATGLEAVRRGYKVSFNVADTMLTALREARDEKTLNQHVARLASFDLLIIDELGYFSCGPDESNMLFRVVSSRHEVASTIVTTNCPFASWGNFISDQHLLRAMLDRLVYNSIIINMNGPESFRLKAAKSRRRSPLAVLDGE